MTTSKTLLGAYEESDVELECEVESFPRSVNYWTKVAKGGRNTGSSLGSTSSAESYNHHHQEVMLNGDRYEIREQHFGSLYAAKMTLRIRSFSVADAGSYMCISSNAFGKANRTIRLYGTYLGVRPFCLRV